MAGIALLLDLVKRRPSSATSSAAFTSSSIHLSAAAAATAAATLAAAGLPLSGRSYIRERIPVAYCDAAAIGSWKDSHDHFGATEKVDSDSLEIKLKVYPLELKPLFSAFAFKPLALTTIRSFLLFYLPVLEPRLHIEEEDDIVHDTPRERPVDLVTPFRNSVKQIIREVSVVTTRRVLERITVYHVSPRMAWKLLKDASRSAKRKAGRGMPVPNFFYSVGRTTFRAHCLGVAASWVVQIIIEMYRCFLRKPVNKFEELETTEKFRLFGKKVYSTTVKCGASLVFASVGAGIGAVFNPSMGQWIGCAIGDYAGPIIGIMVLEKLHFES